MKTREELMQTVFKHLSKTGLKMHLESKGAKLSDISDNITAFLSRPSVIPKLNKSDKLSSSECAWLSNKMLESLCTNEALADMSFGEISKLFSIEFWQKLHIDTGGPTYQYSYFCKNNDPVLMIENIDSGEELYVEGFDDFGNLMGKLLIDFSIPLPEDIDTIPVWCYDGISYMMDGHNKLTGLKHRNVYISFAERLALLDFITKNVLLTFKSASSDTDSNIKGSFKKEEKSVIEKPVLKVIEEMDDEGYVGI